MHTTQVEIDGEVWACHHNGDFSGNVTCVKDNRGGQELVVPFAVMAELVGKKLGDDLIGLVESKTGRELLECIARGESY